MRRACRPLTSDLRFPVVFLCAFAFVSVITASALTEGNPYSTIVGRNTFALKPPAPPAGPITAPPTPPPNVSLQGISTILGRAQALLKVKIGPKPPDAAKELALVMDVGQREGDVEVLSIDPATGTVNLSNQGNPLTLNIKDADKPAAGSAIVASGNSMPLVGAGARPLVPPITPMPTLAIPNSAIPTYQKPADFALPSAQAMPALPTRQLRGNAQPTTPNTLSAVEQAVLMEVERIRTKDLVKQGKYPPLPPIPGAICCPP